MSVVFSCRFSDIKLEDGSGIPTQAFLDSCYAIVPVLGRTLYLSLSLFRPFFALSLSSCWFCRLSHSPFSLALCLLEVVKGSWGHWFLTLSACVGSPCALDFSFFFFSYIILHLALVCTVNPSFSLRHGHACSAMSLYWDSSVSICPRTVA